MITFVILIKTQHQTPMAEREYIHGYSEEEQNRLIDQGSVLAEFVFDGLDFKDSQYLLEVGSGVGAQTAILLRDYPKLHITGIEIEEKQIEKNQAKGIILDLRNNPGGLLHEAVKIVNLFVPKDQLVVSTKSNIEAYNQIFETQKQPLSLEIPLVILINQNNANTSNNHNRVENINEEKRKLEVMVKIFGRKTTLELSYMQVDKI